MKWLAAELADGSPPDRIAVGRYERFETDDDGVFETPDDLDASAERRLEEAGHERIEEGDDVDVETDSEGGADEPDEDDAEAESADDEYADMDRSELYEEYKERGGPASWNETTADELRDVLRELDDGADFADPEEEET